MIIALKILSYMTMAAVIYFSEIQIFYAAYWIQRKDLLALPLREMLRGSLGFTANCFLSRPSFIDYCHRYPQDEKDDNGGQNPDDESDGRILDDA